MSVLLLATAFVVAILLYAAIFFERFLRKSWARRPDWVVGIASKPAADRQHVSKGEAPREATTAFPGTPEPVEPLTEWWVSADYFWIVLCKNQKFHRRLNASYAHRIPLGRTDSVLPKPVSEPFRVCCDVCGKEYAYAPSEVMRWEMKAPQSFEPHPFFRD
jgi:hypothetical protein